MPPVTVTPAPGRHWSCTQEAIGSVEYRVCGSPKARMYMSGAPAVKALRVGNTKIPAKRFARRASSETCWTDTPKTELVVPSHHRGCVNALEMVFGTGGIQDRRVADADDTRNSQKGALGIRRQIDSAACELQADLVDERWASDLLPTDGKRLIAVTAGYRATIHR